MPLCLAFTFYETQKEGFVPEKQTVTHVTKKCDTLGATFLELFLLNCNFFKQLMQCCWQVFFESK